MEEREIELIDYINVILKRKRFIIVGTLIFVLIASIYSFGRRAPTVYEAKASLLVIPPPFKAEELMTSNLPIHAYERLARAQDLEKAIIDSLNLGFGINRLDGMMDVEVVKGKTSPLITFSVQSDSADLSIKIVNNWADLFVKKNSGLTSQAISGSYEFILNQYNTAQELLKNKEDALQEFMGTNHLAILSNERDPEFEKLKEIQVAFTQQRADLRAKEDSLRHQEYLLAALDIDGKWIGALVEEGAPIHFENLTEEQVYIRKLAVEATRTLLQAEEDLISFKDEYRIELLKAEVDQKIKTLAAHQEELVTMDLGREKTRVSLEQIDQQLKQQSLTLVLSKAITDDALWQKNRDGTLSPDDLKKLERLKLRSEELNPVYIDLLKKKASLQLEHNSYSPKKVILKQEIEKLKNELPMLEKRLRAQEKEQFAIQNRLEIARKALDSLLKRYSAVKSGVEQTRLDIVSRKERMVYSRSALDAYKSRFEGLDEQLDLLELEQARLDRDVGMYKSTLERFGKLSEDARVAKAGEVSDLKVVARAVVATVVVPEKRSTVMLAGGIGLVVTVFLAFLMEYVEKARLKNEDGTDNK